MAQVVKNLPAVQETWVRSLTQEDPLEKEMATHSRIIAWKIPRTEEPGGVQSMGLQRVGHNCATNFHFTYIGHPTNLQCWINFVHNYIPCSYVGYTYVKKMSI